MMSSSVGMLPKLYSTIDEIENDLRNNDEPHILSPTTAIDTDNDIDDTLKDNNTNDKDVGDSSKQPHLFLHFDINETILIGDPAGGDTVTECLNKIIAKSAFVSTLASSSDSNKEGNDTDKRPQLKRTPSSGNINESSTHQLQPTHWWNGNSIDNDDDTSEEKNQPPLYTGWTYPSNTCPYYRTSYKRYAKQFTLVGNHGSVYRPLYDALCTKLGLSDDNDDDEHEEEDNVFQNFVPSFFHTLQHYFPSTTAVESSNNRLQSPSKVTLVLRTFGTDLPRVAKCISEFAQGNHPSYPDYYNADLILDESNLFCSKWTYCNAEEGEERELIYELHSMIQDSSASIHSGDDEVLDYLLSKSIVGIQDNYLFWRDNNHQPWSGKPVWARTNGSSNNHPHNHHHILLDDNIHNDPNDGAGGIRIPVSGSDMDKSMSSYESLHGNEALEMHGKHLIRVPTIRPLLEDDWFIQQIENARLRVAQEEAGENN